MSSESERSPLTPDAAPPWLKPLVDNARAVKRAYRRRVPAELLAVVTAANAKAALTGSGRDAAVLVLFSGPQDSPSGGLPDDADLLVTVRASTLRHHAGQAAFPGGAADPGDEGPIYTALREATEPAFLLNEMLVWGFTGQVISAILDVAGWAQPWNTDDVRELDDAMALVGHDDTDGEAQL